MPEMPEYPIKPERITITGDCQPSAKPDPLTDVDKLALLLAIERSTCNAATYLIKHDRRGYLACLDQIAIDAGFLRDEEEGKNETV